MNTDSPLRSTPTHAAQEFPGSLLGIETPRFLWVSAALLLGFALFAWLHYALEVPLITAASISLAPALVVAGFILVFLQNRPPGFARDLIESWINRGHHSPTQAPVLCSPLPDCYLTHGLILHGGPRRGGRAARALWFEPPALHNASNAERNRFQDSIRQLIRLLPPGYSLDVSWWVDSDYQEPIRRYQQGTQQTSNPLVKRTRNQHFLWHWQQMQQRQLRRERVAIVLCRSLTEWPATPWAGAVSFYDETLQQLAVEFGELEKQIAALFAAQGGRLQAMNDADHFRVFARKLNPSLLDRPEDDPLGAQDPGRSVFESCWNSELCGQGRQGFFLDGYYHGVVQLRRWPGQTYPTLIHKLTQLGFGDYDITARIERLPADKVIVQEQKDQDRIIQQLDRKHDERLVVSREQKGQRIHRLSEGNLLPLTFQLTVVVRARSPELLSERMLAVKTAIHGMNGAQYLELTLPAATRNAFFQTLPGMAGSGGSGVRLYGEDSFAADLLPLSGSFLGHLETAGAIYPGTHGNLVGIKAFTREATHATGVNTIVLGAAGTGKSLQIQNMLRQSEPGVDCTVIIEEGFSHAEYTRSFGAEPITFRLDGDQSINLWDTRGDSMTSLKRASITAAVARMVGLPADEDKARQRQAVIAKHVARLCSDHAEDWLQRATESDRQSLIRETLARQRWADQQGLPSHEAGVEFRLWQIQETEAAALLLEQISDEDMRAFEGHPAVRDAVFARLQPGEHLTLSSLREYLELNAEGMEAEECQWLATLLTPWCRGGNYGVLFDGASTVSLEGPVVHFELGGIPEAAKEIKTLVGFLIINDVRQLFVSLPRPQLKRILVEEMSRFLDVPGGETILRELFEQFRKFTVQVIVVVQQYARIADTPIRAALMGNARAFLIFNTGDRQDVERLGRDIGLSSVAQEAILRFPRPDQQTGARYSEFCYFHTDPVRPICGTARYILLSSDGYTQQTDPSTYAK